MPPKINLADLEKELRQRLAYPYDWGGRKQNDADDRQTNFIYHTAQFSDLLARIDQQGKHHDAREHARLKNYALNRWFNFWSAVAIEEIFCSIPGVTPAKQRDRLVDFQICGMTFDHKTSVFPLRYGRSVDAALAQPADLIKWLYTQQSTQQRQHFANRLFLVLVNRHNVRDSWKLKAEILWLQPHIENYVRRFNPASLTQFTFTPPTITRSDIIWAIKADEAKK